MFVIYLRMPPHRTGAHFVMEKKQRGFWASQDSEKHKLFGIKGYFLRPKADDSIVIYE